LVLAGANREGAKAILTAEEVCSLDLRGCELVVLSACETGLGRVASGEGVLGLHKAFHLAGARAVAASLWQVPDRATQVLMERFYDNLWTRKMTPIEALRQAQIWLLRHGLRHPEVVRGLYNPKTGTGKVSPGAAAPGKDGQGRLQPFYWAAFVLSGVGR
jgi:CHAT domain-containing protein